MVTILGAGKFEVKNNLNLKVESSKSKLRLQQKIFIKKLK